jgi:hypothetical protein
MMLPSLSVDFVSLRGGIDLASTVLKVDAGAALTLWNFEPELEGGYRRIAGYERTDGRAAPSAAVYYTVSVADGAGISVGDTLTGVDSGAASKVVIKDGNTLGVTALTGNYDLGEVANGTTITAVEEQSGQNDNTTDDIWQLAAEDYYRSLIGAVTGDGNALYAFQFGAVKYAFRADSGTVKLYKTSSSGWTHVPFFHVLFWDGGVLAEGDIAPGDTVTGATSSASATVKKIIKNSGSYGADASGYMVLQMTSGTFQNNENVQKGGVTKMVADGANAAITLAPGGTFQHIAHNFYATSATKAVYGCDGVNPAWEFDGTTLCPIYFPAPDEDPAWNAPTYIAAFRQHLFLAFAPGTIAHSSPGEPLIFSALLGAAEFGLGDEPTGMAARAGEVLAIYTRGKTYGLYGYSSADWTLQVISETFGAKHRTVESLGTVYALDDKGIAPLERVQAYGDFESATVSRYVKKILDEYKDSILAAVPVKERNQYRLFFTDGTALVMAFDTYVGSQFPAFSLIQYTDTPTFVSASEDENGNEVLLFGDASGYIYQSEKGYNFDGDAIEFAYRTPFMNQKSPHLIKSYRDIYIDIDAQRPFSMSVTHELSFAELYAAQNNAQSLTFSGGGGYWDVNNWDEFYWDAEAFSSRGMTLAGDGNNISFLFYGNSKYVRPFTIQTIEIHYLMRSLKRAKNG